MNRVEINIGGKKIDLYSDINYSITLQSNDFAELRTRQFSYTNKFKIPKTSKNKILFDLLGETGSVSEKPYRVIRDLSVSYNGVQVVNNGYGYLKDTDKDYNIVIYDGLIDFLETIRNKTLEELDYSDINHEFDINTIVNSWDNDEGYIYGVCKTIHPLNRFDVIADLPCPAIYLKTLFEKISDISGYTFNGDLFLDDLFLKTVMSTEKSFVLPTNTYVTNDSASKIYNLTTETDYSDPDPIDIIGGNYIRLNFNWSYSSSTGTIPEFEVLVNGSVVGSQRMNESQGQTTLLVYGLNVSIRVKANNSNAIQTTLNLEVTSERLQETSIPVLFSDIIGDFSIREFIKQIITKFGINIIADPTNKTIEFCYINNYNDAEIIDLSDTIGVKTKETYTLGSYAKDNYFRYNYEDGQINNSDGFISYGNETGDLTRTHFTSAFNAPNFASDKYENLYFSFNDEIEIKEQSLKLFHVEDDDTVYFIKMHRALNGKRVTSSRVFKFEELQFQKLINRYYIFLRDRVFLLPKKINIPIKINALRFVNYDLKKLYYIKQEASLFLIGKIKYNSRNESTAELIRVSRRLSDQINPVPVITGQCLFTSGNTEVIDLTSVNSYDPDGFIASQQWIVYNDNNQVVFNSVNERVNELSIIPGQTFTFCLTVTDNSGLTGSLCKTVKSTQQNNTPFITGLQTLASNNCYITKQFIVTGAPNTTEVFNIETSITNGGSNTFINEGQNPPVDCFLGGCNSLGFINGSGEIDITVMYDSQGEYSINVSIEAFKDINSPTANTTTVVISNNSSSQTLITKQWTNEALC